MGMLQYREIILYPTSPLPVYTGPLTSKSFDFVTSLSISVEFPVPELLQLANMSNLGILEIFKHEVDEPSDLSSTTEVLNVGDMLVRAWSREASERGAFTVLRILRLLGHRAITSNVLLYLQAFPALAIFDARGCGICYEQQAISQAETLGWKTLNNNYLLQALENECIRTSPGRQSAAVDSPVRGLTGKFWGGERVSRLDRASTQAPRNQDTNCRIGTTSPIVGTLKSREFGTGTDCVAEVATGDEIWNRLNRELFRHVRDADRWEFKKSFCWARVGEIRGDTDLKEAGVKGIDKQTFVDDKLVSPVPMAYIRLGKKLSEDFWDSPMVQKRKHWFQKNLVFVRIEYPSTTSVPVAVATSEVKRSTQIRQSKKRKLGDVLGDILRA